MNLAAGADLDALVAAACGFDYQVVNDVCYVCTPATSDGYGEKWQTFRPSISWSIARATAKKLGLQWADEKYLTATALEICAAILSVNR